MPDKINPEERRVKPDVYIAALLDEANEHLLEVKDILNDRIIPEKPKKSIPYNSGLVSIASVLRTQPPDPSGYTVTENVYANNNNKPIPQMYFINSGPGNIYYVVFENAEKFSNNEEMLSPGERRVLYNVFEIRMRTDMPLTRYRLVENEMSIGSFSNTFKNYVENRVVLQPNEFGCEFEVLFDTDINPVPGTALPTDNSLFIRQNPLAAGASAFFTNTIIYPPSRVASSPFSAIVLPAPMPFTIPTGWIAEGFAFCGLMSRNFSLRDWMDVVPGSGVYTLLQTWTFPARSSVILTHNFNIVSTQYLDETGAPSPRNFIFTITNDDAANTMIGHFGIDVILRRLT